MKNKILLILPFLFIAMQGACFSQSNNDTVIGNREDSVVLYRFIGGKPYMPQVRAEEKAASKLGFKIVHEYGDCGGTPDSVTVRIDKMNIPAYKWLHTNLGDDWQKKLDKETQKQLKRNER